jgi:hypothetical protein
VNSNQTAARAVNQSNANAQQATVTDQAIRLMADAIFKQLQEEGCQAKDIISVSSQILGLVTTEISKS